MSRRCIVLVLVAGCTAPTAGDTSGATSTGGADASTTAGETTTGGPTAVPTSTVTTSEKTSTGAGTTTEPATDTSSGDTSTGLSTGSDASTGIEDTGTTGEPVTELPVFVDGVVLQDHVLRIGGPSNWAGVDVGAMATLPGGEVTAKIVDGEGPGTALELTWTGMGQAYVQRTGYITTDLSAFAATETSVVFRVRVDGAPPASVQLQSECYYPCFGEVELGPALAAVADGDWHDLSVPLACLLDSGLAAYQVDIPWLLYTIYPLKLTIEDVRWAPWTAGPDPDCAPFMP